ncbi:MAG: SDR family oxidoreductase [Planctomycetaceae bacterium]
MRILVTGGAGFIGSHTIDELLARGHEPIAFDNLSTGSKNNLTHNIPLIVGDIRDEKLLRELFSDLKPERVCHLAAQMSVSRSVRDPAFDADVNVVGLLRVLECCRDFNVDRIVFASSGGALYGDVTKPAKETDACEPGAPYGISKWVGERYLQYFAEEFGLQSFSLRYANVYGPRQNPLGEAGVVAIFSTQMLDGKSVTINGDGKYVRDYVYVTDVARANADVLEAEAGEPFLALNVGTEIGTDVNQLASSIQTLCKKAREERGQTAPIPPAEHGPARPGDLRTSMVSHESLSQRFGWLPEISLNKGLQWTVHWFSNTKNNHSQ